MANAMANSFGKAQIKATGAIVDVIAIYDGVAIVCFENGDVAKVRIDDFGECKKEENKPEKRVTRDQIEEASNKVFETMLSEDMIPMWSMDWLAKYTAFLIVELFENDND